MSKITESTFSIQGKSGNKHTFGIYAIGTPFSSTGGVYIFTRRHQDTHGKHTHQIVYCGITGDLSTRFNNHHKETEIKKNNANCICVMFENSEKQRANIEADILTCTDNKFPCNDLLNY